MIDWSIIVAVDDETVLQNNLLRSHDVENVSMLSIHKGYANAGQAYNEGIDRTCSEILVFLHQDVYLPGGWVDRLGSCINRLKERDPDWGVLGVYGIDDRSCSVGHVYSTGLTSVLGRAFKEPVEVTALDELLLVLRRGSGLRFDEGLPGFHLYGADICLEARRRGLKSYVIPNFCIHNSNGLRVLPWAYWRSYRYMQKKWSRVLPIPTLCMPLTRSGVPILGHYLRWWMAGRWEKQKVGKRCSDPEALFQTLYKNLEEEGGISNVKLE